MKLNLIKNTFSLFLFLTLILTGVYQNKFNSNTKENKLIQGDPERGKELYKVCVQCHGVNGQGVENQGGPRLAGLQPWYMERQIKNFKKDIRGSHPKDTYGSNMRRMALTLISEQDIQDVISYIVMFEAEKTEPTLERVDAERGKQLYNTCSTCHGPNGQGRENLGAPRIEGQHDWYLVRQVKYFREGIRGTNPDDTYGMQMRPMANALPDEQAVYDVVAYINTLENSND